MAKLIHCEIRDNGEGVTDKLGTARLITLKRSIEPDLDFATIDWHAARGEGTCLKFSKLNTLPNGTLDEFMKILDEPSENNTRKICFFNNLFTQDGSGWKAGINGLLLDFDNNIEYLGNEIQIINDGTYKYTCQGINTIKLGENSYITSEEAAATGFCISPTLIKTNNVKFNTGTGTINDASINGTSFNGIKLESSKTISACNINIYNNGNLTGDAKIKLESNGTITATSFNAVSDRRLKENIKTYTSEKSILDLPIKEFDYKETKQHEIGCIAQDLQELFPELVSEGENGYLSIKETKLVYLLLLEVKKLKEEIDKLKGR